MEKEKMIDLSSTPEFVAGVYETMKKSLPALRRRLGRPLTLTDKILLSHLGKPEEQEMIPGISYLHVRPDRVILQDALGQFAMLQFMQTGKKRVALPTTMHCDHLTKARLRGDLDLSASNRENKEIYDFLKSAAARYGIGFWAPGAGIMHQINLENYAFPGAVILGIDSHTPNAGGLGACAVGVGGADAVDVMAGLDWEVLHPKRIGVLLTGELSGWTAPKDVILRLAGQLTVSGGTNSIIEYFGPGAESISCTGKATITNMGAELGATTSIFAYDQAMARYLQATGRADLARLADQNRELLSLDPEVIENPEQFYGRVVRIDLSTLEPHVVGPHSPDRSRPLSELAGEVAENDELIDSISACLIGSCTNSSYEDMSRAADLADQARSHGVKSAVPLMITPGSEQIRATIERDGQLTVLKSIGATLLANACGPCIGQWHRDQDVSGKANTIVTSYNRNFPRRNDGQPTTMNFIASPEVTIGLALGGRLSFNPLSDTLTGSDGRPFRLKAPKKMPDVPKQNYERADSFYVAPPDDGSDIVLEVDPHSDRLQLLEPWPPWDGRDVVDAPILLKTRGKTTTDAITPAGPWLRLRGHLDKTSDSLFMGAINAYDNVTGSGLNVLTGERGQSFSEIARHYKASNRKWVVIGDWNYGEGSSREHAALCPKLLGAAAVIARSFARIHESNLKRQGLLALTFEDPDVYDLIGETDRIDLVNLAELKPGQPLTCIVKHEDGTRESFDLKHTCNEAQVEWFKAGSALNLIT